MWKEYPYNNSYLVSDTMQYDNNGRYYQVVNRLKKSNVTEIGFKPLYGSKKNTGGYWTVHLQGINPKSTHVVVFETYHPEISLVGYEIDHIDDNKFNNNLTNLRRTTRKGNLNKSHHKRLQILNQPHTQPLYAINIKTRRVKYYSSMNICSKELGIDRKTITDVIKRDVCTGPSGYILVSPDNFNPFYITDYLNKLYHLKFTPVYSVDSAGTIKFYPNSKSTGLWNIKDRTENDREYSGLWWYQSKYRSCN